MIKNHTEPTEDPRAEALLRQLAHLEEAAGDAAESELSDSQLIAYREGGLEQADARRVERALGDHPSARQRLAAVAGVEVPRPSADLRERALASLAQGTNSQRSKRWWFPASMALAASLVFGIGFQHFRSLSHLPSDLSYDVVAQGVARERSMSTAGQPLLEAFPETLIRLDVTPQGNAIAGLEIGLFRLRDDRLERLAPGDALRQESFRGAARFTARAADLVGDRPGTYEVFVVVAREGGLPENRVLEPGQTPEAALTLERRRQVYRQRIQLLPAAVP